MNRTGVGIKMVFFFFFFCLFDETRNPPPHTPEPLTPRMPHQPPFSLLYLTPPASIYNCVQEFDGRASRKTTSKDQASGSVEQHTRNPCFSAHLQHHTPVGGIVLLENSSFHNSHSTIRCKWKRRSIRACCLAAKRVILPFGGQEEGEEQSERRSRRNRRSKRKKRRRRSGCDGPHRRMRSTIVMTSLRPE